MYGIFIKDLIGHLLIFCADYLWCTHSNGSGKNSCQIFLVHPNSHQMSQCGVTICRTNLQSHTTSPVNVLTSVQTIHVHLQVTVFYTSTYNMRVKAVFMNCSLGNWQIKKLKTFCGLYCTDLLLKIQNYFVWMSKWWTKGFFLKNSVKCFVDRFVEEHENAFEENTDDFSIFLWLEKMPGNLLRWLATAPYCFFEQYSRKNIDNYWNTTR